MSTPKAADGGPVFPVGATFVSAGAAGLSLRDYFAAAALPEAIRLFGLPSGKGRGQCVESSPEKFARICYSVADAMLAAREGGGR